MTQPSGPYDGRKARRKRCDRCVERRIKCVGDFPCLNCSKTNRTCRATAKPKTTAPIFVHATQATFAGVVPFSRKEATISSIPPVPFTRSDSYLTYFFVSFLRQNAFTSITTQFETSLSSLVRYSPELHDAVNAIAALHISQQGQFPSTRDDEFAALKSYSRSVHCIQVKITSKSFVCDPSASWTTLLLGLFELMRDHTGTNWLAHFLHGTSTILCLQGPSILTLLGKESKIRQAFFFSARIFEISRALIYTEPTFLAEPQWSAAIQMYWIQNPAAWTPKEALFDILPQFVDLGIRTLCFVTNTQEMLQQERDHVAISLAQEGLVLQSTLVHWHSSLSSWASTHVDRNTSSSQISIALVYYHTILIYLDGIFSYHMPFISSSAPVSPILNPGVVGEHVRMILKISRELLGQGCAGVLLLFPLRVAGARARDDSTQSEIIQLLQMITQRGFAVAQSFVNDLNAVWTQWCKT